MIKQVVVTDAWFEHDGVTLLNPALKTYETAFLSMKQSWDSGQNHTPLSYYASLAGLTPTALVAGLSDKLPKDVKQLWLASPYHARLTRASLRVMPESMLDWTNMQAKQVCDALNPLLKDDGLELVQEGELLLLLSKRVWDIQPHSFANIAGQSLPDRHMQGSDAGVWARLLSEVQMTLHQAGITTECGLDIQGLWFWGEAGQTANLSQVNLPNVASQNIYLNTVLKRLGKQQGAELIVSDAESLPMLLPTVLPEQWLLLGAGKSVRLKNNMLTSALAKLSKPQWKGI